MSAVVRKGHWCPECEVVTEPVRVYECDTDGWQGTENRCEQCNKFAARRESDGCEDCFSELQQVEVVTDHDGTEIRLQDYEPNGKALAVRRKEAVKTSAKKSKDDYEKKAAALLATVNEKPWSEVVIGEQIVVKDWTGKLDFTKDATVVSLETVGENCDSLLTPGSTIAVIDQYGSRLQVHYADATVLVRNDSTPVQTVAVDDRFILRHGSDTHGSSIKMVSFGVGLSTFSDSPVYIAEIIGKTSKHSSAQTLIGSFAQPKEAAAFAEAALAAAAELRQMRLFDGPEVEISPIEDFMPLSHTPTRFACFTVGADDFTQEFGVSVRAGATASSGHTFGVADAAVLEAIGKAALEIADRLSKLIDAKG